MDLDHFAASTLFTLNDHILSISMYMLCLRCYLEPDDDPRTDFMLSPIKTPGEIFAKFPKVFMLMCELDPIHDDNIRFIHKFM